MKRRKWNKSDEEELISLRVSGVEWQRIAEYFDSTEQAVARKYHYLQKTGRAPYSHTPLLEQIDDVKKHYSKFGHRSTLAKYGSYAIHFLRRNGLWERTHPVIKVYPDRFLASDDKYYWAGFFAADGCVKSHRHISITLASKDKEYLLGLHALSGGSFYVYDKCVTWDMHNAGKIVSFFADLNITPRKTHTLMPPESLSEKHARDYIRGYLDGDGCITSSIQKSGQLVQSFCFNGTRSVLEWIRKHFGEHAGCATWPAVRKDRGICVLSYGSRGDFKAIGTWLYADGGEKMKRKHMRYKQIVQWIDSI